jgi:predicted secreted Zn-dependent protease
MTASGTWSFRASRLVPLTVSVLIVLWGCAALPPVPQRESIILRTSNSTKYYPVRGATTSAIFDDIGRNGLFDNKARREVGLTSGEWSLDWRGTEMRPGLCSPGSLTITLTLVITLPEHSQLKDLSPDVRMKWQRFAASVAAHEQRHVDIYLTGATTMKARMEAALTQSSSCAELEKTIRTIWIREQAETEQAQDTFHVDDEAKIRNDRKPLQGEIHTNQTRLAAIHSDIQDLDQTLADLKRQSDALHVRIDAVKATMSTSRVSPAHCSQSPVAKREIQALCQRYGTLVAAINALAELHNQAISRRGSLVDEHNRVVEATNGLIEALSWTR